MTSSQLPSEGFPPVVGRSPVLLILGSMPGQKSLIEHQYYAFAQNAFWRIMRELLAIPEGTAYDENLQHLKHMKIALWDVIAQCVRPGSLDSSIDKRTVEVNDFGNFFQQQPCIECIIFNGARAATEFQQRVVKKGIVDMSNRELLTLPSTSPANARLSYAQKLSKWKIVTDILSRHRVIS